MVEFGNLSNKNRVYGLDILRAFAILNVVYEHGYRLLDKTMLDSVIVSYEKYNIFVVDGVSIFFVLSGFLIGQIIINLFQQRQIAPKDIYNFWIKRWCRTLPNYFLILSILGGIFVMLKGIKWVKLIPYYLFSQNLFYPISWFFPESWSLSVEEWFYLIVPLLVLALIYLGKIKGKSAVLFTAFIIIVGVTLYRIIYSHYNPCVTIGLWDLNLRKVVVTRLDSIMYGVLAAYVFVFYKEWWLKYKNSMFVLGLIIFLSSRYLISFEASIFYNDVFSFSIVSIGTALLLPFLSSIRYGKGWLFKFITFISIISYSMYLINLILVQNILLPYSYKLVGADYKNAGFWFVKYILFWVYTIGGSYLIFVFWERPTTALRERLVIK